MTRYNPNDNGKLFNETPLADFAEVTQADRDEKAEQLDALIKTSKAELQ